MGDPAFQYRHIGSGLPADIGYVGRRGVFVIAPNSLSIGDENRFAQHKASLLSNSAAVFLALGGPHPLERSESALEEGVIYDIALVVFSRYDPIASMYYPLAKIGDYGHGSCAPCCLH